MECIHLDRLCPCWLAKQTVGSQKQERDQTIVPYYLQTDSLNATYEYVSGANTTRNEGRGFKGALMAKYLQPFLNDGWKYVSPNYT